MKTTFRFLFLLLILFSCEKKVSRYTLTTSVSPSGSGSISPQNGIFDKGETVELKATPSGLYTFKEWTGDLVGNNKSEDPDYKFRYEYYSRF